MKCPICYTVYECKECVHNKVCIKHHDGEENGCEEYKGEWYGTCK